MVDAASVKHILNLYEEAHDLLDEVQKDALAEDRPALIRAMAEAVSARRYAIMALQS